VTSDPDTYTHGHHDAVLRSHRWRTAENSAAYLLPWLRPGASLLDVGCGPGTLTVDLARRVAPAPVVGIDVATSVISEAREHAAKAGVTNVSFESGDFREAGLDDGSFDVVHAHQVLQHLRDPVGAIAKMARLACPGGIVAARDADYSAMTWRPADHRLNRWREVYLAVTRRNGADANAGRWLLGWADAAGLSHVKFTTSMWTFATPSERDWWADLWAERTVASSFAGQAVSYGVATERELAEIAEGWREWGQQPDATFIVVHGEILARRSQP
jgi:SAM-dependent methyltransferase